MSRSGQGAYGQQDIHLHSGSFGMPVMQKHTCLGRFSFTVCISLPMFASILGPRTGFKAHLRCRHDCHHPIGPDVARSVFPCNPYLLQGHLRFICDSYLFICNSCAIHLQLHPCTVPVENSFAFIYNCNSFTIGFNYNNCNSSAIHLQLQFMYCSFTVNLTLICNSYLQLICNSCFLQSQ